MGGAQAWLVSVVAAVIPTVVYVLVLWWFDRYEKEPRRLLLVAFVWGAVPAVIVSILAEYMLGQPLASLSESAAELMSSSVLAPVVEEVAKGLAVFLLFLVFHREFDNVLDGIIYGATIGFGFAMTENVFYFRRGLATDGAQGLTLIVFLRAFVFGLNHALFTSVFGAVLGHVRMAQRGCQRWLIAPLGLLGAMVLHAIHNTFATLADVACFSIALSLVSDWGGVLVIFAVMALAWQQEKRWIATHLRAEVASGLLTQDQYDMISSYRRRLLARWQAWSRYGRSEARAVSRLAQLSTELAFKVEQGDKRTAGRLSYQQSRERQCWQARSAGTDSQLPAQFDAHEEDDMAGQAAAQPLNRFYDAVVVGAGNGGLGAAAQLAAKGVKVLLLEQHNVPGGFATSFVRGRFEFDSALHVLAGIGSPTAKGAFRSFYEDELDIHLDWVEVPDAFRLILTDAGEELDVTMPHGVQEFIDALERHVPGCREVVTKYLDLCKEVFDAITYIGQSRGNPDRKVLTSEYANFLKTAPYTVDQVANALKVPQEVRKILHAMWVYLGPPTSRMSFTIYALMVNLFLSYGSYLPRHRSHEMATALGARIRELSGETQYNTRVDQILVESGQVVGVVTCRGDRIAARHVIADVSPTLVYNRLISPRSEVPEIAYQECNARLNGLGTFVVYMGLDTTLEALGVKDYGIFVFGNMNTDEMYETFETIDAPRIQAVACLNNVLPDCSPPGTSVVSITTLYRPEVWQNVKPQDYVAVKNRIASQLIADFEKATGARLREHIEEIEVATPVTLARYTGTYGGVAYGYEPEPWDAIVPRMMAIGEEKHISGLAFCGGFAFRSHGYYSSTLSGQTVALMTLRDLTAERG